MESVDLDYTVFVILVVLVSIGRIVRLLLATLKVCVKEYYEFRSWLRAVRRESQGCERKDEEI